MEPERPTWLEKKLTRSDMRAITKAIRSGLLSQMPWIDIRIGQSPSRSSREEPHKPRPIRRIKFFRHDPLQARMSRISYWFGMFPTRAMVFAVFIFFSIALIPLVFKTPDAHSNANVRWPVVEMAKSEDRIFEKQIDVE